MAKRKTHEEFIKELSEKNPMIEVLGTYVRANDYIAVRCKKCGYNWSPRPSVILRGHGCPKCAGSIKRTHAEFLEELSEKNSLVEVLGIYKNAVTHVEVKCKKCGYIWPSKPIHLLRGHACPKCAGHMQFSHDEFLEKLEKVNDKVEILGIYVRTEMPIETKCKLCGHIWSPRPHDLLGGYGCPVCGRKQAGENGRKSHEEYVSELFEKNKEIEVLGTYVKSDTRIHVKCKICGYEWNPKPYQLLNGTGCPNCNHTSTSFTEQFIYFALEHVFKQGHVLNRCNDVISKELDIYVPEFKFAIEPGSWYWHKDKVIEDKNKINECLLNGIDSLVIYDAFKGNVSDFDEHYLLYDYDLGCESGHITLKNIVMSILNKLNVDYYYSNKDWKKISQKAYRNSRRLTDVDFRNKLEKISPNIEVLGAYVNSKTRIRVKCKVCGDEWNPRPAGLLQGYGCVNCAGSKKKTTEEFVLELRDKNPDVEVLGIYKSRKDSIKVKCLKCGCIWNPQAGNLLNGHGCKKCGQLRASQRRKKTHEEFIKELSEKNPMIEVLGTYVKSNENIDVKCKVCGREWSPRPIDLLRGHGCRQCAYRMKKR